MRSRHSEHNDYDDDQPGMRGRVNRNDRYWNTGDNQNRNSVRNERSMHDWSHENDNDNAERSFGSNYERRDPGYNFDNRNAQYRNESPGRIYGTDQYGSTGASRDWGANRQHEHWHSGAGGAGWSAGGEAGRPDNARYNSGYGDNFDQERQMNQVNARNTSPRRKHKGFGGATKQNLDDRSYADRYQYGNNYGQGYYGHNENQGWSQRDEYDAGPNRREKRNDYRNDTERNRENDYQHDRERNRDRGGNPNIQGEYGSSNYSNLPSRRTGGHDYNSTNRYYSRTRSNEFSE